MVVTLNLVWEWLWPPRSGGRDASWVQTTTLETSFDTVSGGEDYPVLFCRPSDGNLRDYELQGGP